jgi:signal transduction histidine kinase
MTARGKNNHSDWVLGGFMLLLCAGLTVLQYRWTGEIANAELIRLRGNLDEQARALTRAFDTELSDGCDQLLPHRENFGKPFQAADLAARFKAWQAANPRPMFSRIAFVAPADNDLQFSLLDPAAGQFVPTNWPGDWAALRKNLSDKLTSGGSPPFHDERGLLMEIPVFTGGQPGGGPPKTGDFHWLILELDAAYARDIWLPELVARYLNPDGRPVNEARVRPFGGSSMVLYASQTNTPDAGTAEVSLRFNGQGRTENNSRGPFMGGPFGQFQGGRWLLEAWHRPGVLESVVAASRHRNLAVAGALNALMLATGIALVRHTRRSRHFAETQMNFVANVSHELRTPLTVIRGAAHNLKRGIVHERSQIEQYSGLILQHTEQLSCMVEQLLELAGGKKNRVALSLQPVALNAVLKEALAAAKDDTQAAGCSVECNVPATLPVVSGDAAALRRVFQNLITNAAKHADGGAWIGVTAAAANGADGPEVEVRVADRGPGIPEAEQAEIFKPFVRGALAEEKQVRGSGLGLSVVLEIVKLHHGSVSVSSKPGHGAVFTVRLPASPSQPQ